MSAHRACPILPIPMRTIILPCVLLVNTNPSKLFISIFLNGIQPTSTHDTGAYSIMPNKQHNADKHNLTALFCHEGTFWRVYTNISMISWYDILKTRMKCKRTSHACVPWSRYPRDFHTHAWHKRMGISTHAPTNIEVKFKGGFFLVIQCIYAAIITVYATVCSATKNSNEAKEALKKSMSTLTSDWRSNASSMTSTVELDRNVFNSRRFPWTVNTSAMSDMIQPADFDGQQNYIYKQHAFLGYV